MMFYCVECATKNEWPRVAMRTFGPCEICKNVESCNDFPAARLPTKEQKANR